MDALLQEAIEYIQEVSSLHRPDRNIAKNILELNKIINRLDIEKDAKTGSMEDGTMVQTKDPYTTAMAQLFRGISPINYSNQLGKIEKDIFDATALGPPGIPDSGLRKSGKKFTSGYMPEHVKNTYYDSGYKPKDFIEDYKSWITPGSFIDPAGRDKPNMPRTSKFPADGESIRIPLDAFGFSGIVFTANMLANNECKVIIKIPGVKDINITLDVNFNSIGYGTNYFCGNPEKNAAINEQPNNANGIAEIKKYVISKELSDFSQILFAIINMIRLRGEQEVYSHCIFTTDNVVAARSRLMGLQSCLQDHKISLDSSSYSMTIYLAELDPEELKATYLNTLKKHNNITIDNIAIAIAKGFIYIGDVKYNISQYPGMTEYLESIIVAINLAVGFAVGEATALDLSPELYKDHMLKYEVKNLINEKGKVTQSLQRLFTVDADLDDKDPILGKTFGARLQEIISKKTTRGSRRKTRKFLNLRKMKGGANKDGEDHPTEIGPWDGSVVAISEGSLLHHMRLILQVNESDFEDFIFRAYNHLTYIRETPLDQRLLYIYENIDRIENSTLHSFKTEYIGYATNPDILSLAPLARARLVAARAYDPMEMLADTPLASEEAIDEEMGNSNNYNNANAYETNAELPNSKTPAQIIQSNSNMKLANYRLKIKNPIRRNFSKNAGTPKKPTSQYFQSITGLTPRGIHVSRKTRKLRNSTFKK